MAVVTDIEHLYTLLPTNGIIAIDGVDGSGKSTLARLFADNIGAAWFDLDSYIATKNGLENYPHSLCYDKLANHIAEEKSQIIVLDGIFLRDVLEQAGVRPDIFIYCRKIEIHAYGNTATDDFEEWDDYPSTIAYRNYKARHRLPFSADIQFEWKKNG